MKKVSVIMLIFVVLIVLGLFGKTYSDEIKKEDCFFLYSLHHTTNGMAHWYDKSNGGLESLTDIPYSKLDCYNCHISSCDRCHKTEIDKKAAYSIKAAQNEETCLHCHSREKAIMKVDKASNQEDVHFAKGMQCSNCHKSAGVHGDGTEYTSMKQPGAIAAKCENCHQSVPSSVSHKIHRDKLDCNSCHVRHVFSCSNCHFETLVKEGKRVAIPLSGWTFLMNYNGKVTSANMQTFVVAGNKTFLLFAPQNSHSIMKEGRKCVDCHATENVRKVQGGKLNLTWLENGELKQTKGVIPVVEGVTYDSVYQDYKNGKWVPIENPPVPVLQYAGYGTPLSKDQLKKLSMPMGKK
jgi:hypothetical protein